jgi:hypothetical protein
MRKKSARNPGGRPPSEARSALVEAQIEKQDEMARRTRRQILDLLDDHLPAGETLAVWAGERDRVRAVVTAAYTAPAAVAAVHAAGQAHGVAAVEHELRRIAYALLWRLADTSDLPAPTRTRRVLRRLGRSRSLAGARARQTRLAAQLIELRERVRAGRHVLMTAETGRSRHA